VSFTVEQKAALAAPLNRSHVKSRAQAGRQLSYIEGWHAIAEANRIFGFDGWSRETVELRQLGEPREVDGKCRVAYLARVRVTVWAGNEGDPVVRDGCGYGSGIDRDLGSAHESALKEAETDAMKRALMTFGNPFGLALYDKDQAQVVTSAPAKADAEPPRDNLGLLPSPDELPREMQVLIRDIEHCKTITDLTDYMKSGPVTDALSKLATDQERNIIREYAKARLVALGWPSKKAA
jgi:DNA repair and recombination protein RAD52